jgi:hypothetical protein
MTTLQTRPFTPDMQLWIGFGEHESDTAVRTRCGHPVSEAHALTESMYDDLA